MVNICHHVTINTKYLLQPMTLVTLAIQNTVRYIDLNTLPEALYY